MSGIAGLIHLDGRPVRHADLAGAVSLLQRRGPDGSAIWRDGPIGLGHAALDTTAGSPGCPQPLAISGGKVVITADARLDNRGRLIADLGRRAPEHESLGDGRLIAMAYEKWGVSCLEHLCGDFAFAIWDDRRRRLFCARDRFGVKPLNIHVQPGRLVALASEAPALMAMHAVPYRLDEGRIADFLVSELEGIDTSSTFFKGVQRLAPASALTVETTGVRQWCYWRLEPGAELRLGSDEAYAETFLDVFTAAVRTRLRGAGRVGSMLSGGMDSSSIVAVASALRIESSQDGFPVFSGVSNGGAECVETRTIQAALALDGLVANSVSHDGLGALLPELERLGSTIDEPFDCHMTLPRAVYLLGRRFGVKAMLDGIDGDTVLGEGSYLACLIRELHWATAWRELEGQNQFWGGAYPAWSEFGRTGWRAFAPRPLRRAARLLRGTSGARRLRRVVRDTLIAPDFAHRIDLAGRLAVLGSHASPSRSFDLPEERVQAIRHPWITAGVERYDRAAASLGIEARHPFLDRRLVEFCVALPGNQKMQDGWPKAILRRAMAGTLPDAVRWRRGKQHLGGAFTMAVARSRYEHLKRVIKEGSEAMAAYTDLSKVRSAWHAFFDQGDIRSADLIIEAAALAEWLQRFDSRPRVQPSRDIGMLPVYSTQEDTDNGPRQENSG